MNAMRKKAALEKHAKVLYTSRDALISALESDEKKYSKEELVELVEVLGGSEYFLNIQTISNGPVKHPIDRSVTIDLSQFDYKNLIGESFKKYVELAGDRFYRLVDRDMGTETPIVPLLRENDMFFFEQYKVDVVVKDRFPGMRETPRDFVGIKVKSDPIKTTRIALKDAHELNAQVLNAHSRAGHGTYFLLKKDQFQ